MWAGGEDEADHPRGEDQPEGGRRGGDKEA